MKPLLKNMERFDEEADGLCAKLNDMVENARPSKKASAKEHLELFDKVMSLMGKMRECRLDARRCATDAAPYSTSDSRRFSTPCPTTPSGPSPNMT
jgi:hypothetical protein